MESYLRVNLLGPGPRLMEKRIYRAAVSQRLRNTAVDNIGSLNDDKASYNMASLFTVTVFLFDFRFFISCSPPRV